MTEISIGAATLAERAHAAATARTLPAARYIWHNPAWAARARQARRDLADLLGIEIKDITVRAVASRPRGAMPGLELAVHDGATTYTFATPYSEPGRVLAVAPCPDCRVPVPTRLIVELADLGAWLAELEHTPPRPGDYLDGIDQMATAEFYTSRHRPECRYSQHSGSRTAPGA
jgi:hypothetical protein